MSTVEVRLDSLQKAMEDFVRDVRDEFIHVGEEFNRVYSLQRQNEADTQRFKDEMKVFQNEMRDFKEEARRDRREMNKRWGEIANSLGIIVEDLISPAVRPAIRKYFNIEPIDFFIKARRHKKDIGKKGEFDIIAVSEDMVFLVEVKSSPSKDKIRDFNETIERFKELFLEYGDKRLIPIFASRYIPDELIEICTEEGFYALAYREWDYMDLLNFDYLK